jgi:hypothetical protein
MESTLAFIEAAQGALTHAGEINLKYDHPLEARNAEKYEPDQIPYSEGLVFQYLPIEFLQSNKQPSFRAVMVHKLMVIKRAFGNTNREAASRINVPSRTFTQWLYLETIPKNWSELEKIDSHYETALEILAIEARRVAEKKLKKSKN